MHWSLPCIIFLDRLAKYLAHNHLFSTPLLPLNILSFGLDANYGNLLELPNNFFSILNLFSILILFYIIFWLHKKKKATQMCALLFILLGGLSNLFDRAYYQYVIDVFTLFNIFVFNIADVMILGGIARLVMTYAKPLEASHNK